MWFLTDRSISNDWPSGRRTKINLTSSIIGKIDSDRDIHEFHVTNDQEFLWTAKDSPPPKAYGGHKCSIDSSGSFSNQSIVSRSPRGEKSDCALSFEICKISQHWNCRETYGQSGDNSLDNALPLEFHFYLISLSAMTIFCTCILSLYVSEIFLWGPGQSKWTAGTFCRRMRRKKKQGVTEGDGASILLLVALAPVICSAGILDPWQWARSDRIEVNIPWLPCNCPLSLQTQCTLVESISNHFEE